MQNNFLLPWFSILNFLILLLLFEYFPFFYSLISPLSLSHGSSDQNQSGLVVFIKFPFFLSHGLWFLLYFLVLYLPLLRKFLHPKVKSDGHVCGLWLVAENSSSDSDLIIWSKDMWNPPCGALWRKKDQRDDGGGKKKYGGWEIETWFDSIRVRIEMWGDSEGRKTVWPRKGRDQFVVVDLDR